MFEVTEEVTTATTEEEAAGVGRVEHWRRTPMRPTSSSRLHLLSQRGATSSWKAVAYVDFGQSSIGPHTPWTKFDGGLIVIWVSQGSGAWVVVVVVVVVVVLDIVVVVVVEGVVVVVVVDAAAVVVVLVVVVVEDGVVIVTGGTTVGLVGGCVIVVVSCCCW